MVVLYYSNEKRGLLFLSSLSPNQIDFLFYYLGYKSVS